MAQTGVYLAGGMKTGWQDELKFIVDAQLAGSVWWIDPRSWADEHKDPAAYTKRDLQGIRDCSVLFAWMDGRNPSGYGMCLEIGYADALGRTIIMADEMKHDWRDRYFDMARECAQIRAQSLFSGASALIQHLRGQL